MSELLDRNFPISSGQQAAVWPGGIRVHSYLVLEMYSFPHPDTMLTKAAGNEGIRLPWWYPLWFNYLIELAVNSIGFVLCVPNVWYTH